MKRDIDWDLEDGTRVNVEYNYTPGCRPSWDDPGHGPEVDVLKITDAAGKEVDVDDDTMQQIADHICENQQEWDDGNRADRAYDEWKDRER